MSFGRNAPAVFVGFVVSLFLTVVALITYGQCVGLDLSHDEHQFIAPGLLWAREGLLPYRDVPLFHQPYLVILDGWVGKNATSPLLAARLVSGTAALLTGLLIFGCAWSATRTQRLEIRFIAAVSITFLWLTSHLFLVSSGRTWNHDLPCLLALSSLAMLLFSEKPGHWHWLSAGLLAGLATSGRLTMAPFAGLLPLTALLWSGIPLKTRLSHLLIAGLGVAAALAPSAWLYLQSTSGYVFGNFEFPRLPLLEADNSRILKTMTPWRKIRFFFKEIVASNLPLALAVMSLGTLAIRQKKLPWQWIVPCLALVVGAFAPSRYEMQHFYIVAPLAALLAAYFLKNAKPVAIYALFVVALISCVLGRAIFANIPQIFHRKDWDVTRVHQRGLDLRSKIGNGKVLTLAPIVVLEGGLSIYPSLATGPFGWKFAYLVPQPRRNKLGLLAPDDLAGIEPPAAILTGFENEKLEKPLVAYAKKLGYVSEPFSDTTRLWRRP